MSQTLRAETTPSDVAPPGPNPGMRRPAWRGWLGVITLAVGCFSFVSTELSPVGLLPQIAHGLGTSVGDAGLLVSGFAIVVAITAAPLTALTATVSRRTLMSALLLSCTAGNVLAAVATQYWVLLLARVLVALAIGVFWSTAAGTAVRLVPERHAVHATTVVIGGLALATVLGVPGATWLGQHSGWHAAFAALAVISLIAMGTALALLPRERAARGSGVGELRRSFASGPIRQAVLVTALVMTGTFLLFTYIDTYLERVSGIGAGAMSILLVLYGAAGVLGTFAVAPLIHRSFERSLLGTLTLLPLSILLLWAFGSTGWLSIALLIPWGAAYGALPVLLQTWVFRENDLSGTHPEAASSLYVTAYNAAIGIGALAGSVIVDTAGAHLIALIGGLVATSALAVAAAGSRRRLVRHTTPTTD